MVIQCQDQKAGLNFNCVIFKMQLIFDIDVFYQCSIFITELCASSIMKALSRSYRNLEHLKMTSIEFNGVQ